MIWDNLAKFYDLFEDIYNSKVNHKLVDYVASCIEKNDVVLECACGTGMISVPVAEKCKKLYATDYSVGMLKEADKKLKKYPNVKIAKASITDIHCKDNRFDKVIAGNVIHLLDEPQKAINELLRVCKKGGKIIIPTYVNSEKKESDTTAKLLNKLGIDFKRQYNFESYKKFFADSGYSNIEFEFIDGKMPSAIAIITKE